MSVLSGGLPKFTATIMQYILGFVALICIGGIVGIFILAQGLLSAKALETDHAIIDAQLAQEELIRLQKLEIVLKEEQSAIDKTSRIVAESQQYMYQDQIVADITEYGRQTGVSIMGFDFGAKPGSVIVPKPGAKVVKGIPQQTLVIIRLDNNMPYTSVIKFLKLIERNTTKMQLAGINLNPNVADFTLVQGPTIELQVFLK